jgi:Raf kinase inhibitor-like YbhB/YbcL family protein
MKAMLVSLMCLGCLIANQACAEGFTLESDDIGGQLSEAQVFNGYGCKGGNTSPQLRWRNVPPGTKSFAVTVYNPDAPTGSGWWHWVVFNIPADIRELKRGAGNPEKNLAPKGSIQSMTDWGRPGYGGACPPKGEIHRHIFTVYALDFEKVRLDPENLLDAHATPAMLGCVMAGHIIAKASLIAYYGRR